ncbi:MAG: glycosyltransferase family 2 protein [Culicoidibacterales bacterium]
MTKAIVTVFTPAYNRAYTIHKCYESLKRQTNQQFKWLVIDDGSTDNTKELITSYQAEGILDITYIYQANQGMHGAHNTAYEHIDTELNVCIDSDDYLTDNAVEKIIQFWEANKSENLAGFIGLDAYENGEIIGTKLPVEIKQSTLFALYHRHGVKGDKKIVYRSELTKKFPYPLFANERYVALAYKYYKLDESYQLGLMNEVLCIVEYLEDGSSLNMFNQYWRNPKGFAFYRLENMKNPQASLKYKFKECVHYVANSLIAKDLTYLKKSNQKVLTFMATPLGIILYFYILKKKN